MDLYPSAAVMLRLAELVRDLFETKYSATQARRELLLRSAPPSGSVILMHASLWIKASGEKTEITPKGATFSLEELQGYVGGYIELVTLLPGNRMMFANEEGLLQELPVNHTASQLAQRWIVGDVVICDKRLVE